MTIVKGALYAASGLFVLAGVFAILPLGALNAFLGWFGPFAYPDDALVTYTVKLMVLIMAWLGVLMAVAVHGADRHGPLLLGLGAAFLSMAALAVGLIWAYALPGVFYADPVTAAIVGALFLVLRRQAAAVQ